MNTKVKKAVIATLLTILLATTAYATAVFLASFTSPQVKVERFDGFFEFSTDNSTWSPATENYTIGNMSWYVRFNITSAYSGTVNINWTLQYWNGSWQDTNVTVTSENIILDGSGNQTIYASSDGSQETNKNWADENGVWRDDLKQYTYFKIKVDFYTP